MRENDREKGLEHPDDNFQDFAYRAIQSSNQYLEETIYDRTISRFGDSDNVSAILVYPEGLVDVTPRESFILAGEITWRRP